MQDILIQLNRVRGVGGSLLVSSDGLPMASALREGLDENQLAATVGTLIEHSQSLAKHLNLGTPRHLHTASEQGSLLLLVAGNGYLVVVIDAQANFTFF
ncbi:MAG TPA: roadblock/LC7 domain-containing protein [Rhizobacter sp.]|nr:roadblock/LC7 domain-containing protein [Rhizobacter sp.]